MAVTKKRAAKARADRLGEKDLIAEKAASAEATAAQAKPNKTRAAKAKSAGAKTANAKPVKAPKKCAAGVVRKSKATSDSERQRKLRLRDEVVLNETATSDVAGTMEQESNPFELARQTLKGSVPAVVEALVALAKQGSHPHAKTLLELTGAKHMFDGEAETQSSSEPWAKLVLQRLDEAEFKAKQETMSVQTESLA